MAGELAGVRTAVETHLGAVAGGRTAVRLGVPEQAKPVTVAAVAAGRDSPTLVLAASPGRASLLAEELALYADDLPIARLPAGERLPYELAEDDPAAIAERDRALRQLRSGERSIVVASWAALAEFRAGPEVEASGTEVRVNATLAPEELQRRLEASGYRLEPLADEPGAAARRGGHSRRVPGGGGGAAADRVLRRRGGEHPAHRPVDAAEHRAR